MSRFLSEVDARVAVARNAAPYQAYLRARAAVGAMMEEWPRQAGEAEASHYWREDMEGFFYLFDASPLIIETLREQCYHLTGVKSYEYRRHHDAAAKDFKWKLDRLRAIDSADLFVPEAPEMGGFGFDVGPGRVNIDTLKFYEVMIGLQKAGFLQPFREAGVLKTMLEIGSGWGGFAYQFKKLCPGATIVCLDLPPTLLFSATYLMALFPEARCLLYGEADFDAKARDLSQFDFVFLPHYRLDVLQGQGIDLAINMVSFQEMTTAQVEHYVDTLARMRCERLYSLNRDRSKHNTQLSSVRDILARRYAVKPIDLLDLQYTQIAPPKAPAKPNPLDYRHSAAQLK